MNKVLPLLAALILMLAVGCQGGGGQNVVGSYKGEMTMPEGDQNDMAAQMAKAMMGNLTLELKADKTFVMNMMVVIEGTYEVSGDEARLSVTKFMGMSKEDAAKQNGGKASELDKPMVFKISDGGKTLTAVPEPGKEKEGSLVFKRA